MLIRAAGAVAWRPGPDGDEVLLVHRTKYDDWSVPKGKQEPDEPLPLTATREVLEETGAVITLGRRLAPVRYKVNGSPKRVDFWAAQVTAMDDAAVPNAEVDKIAWLPVAAALRRVSYKQDVAVLTDFAAGIADTTPFILLRHARALPRSDWGGDDGARPLDKAGVADAALLAGLLTSFAPGGGFAPQPTVVSSPAVRCLDTVRPYADITGSTVRPEDSLRALSRSAAANPASLIYALIVARDPAIVCAHRENLPFLLEAALVVTGTGADGNQVPASARRPLPKGGLLVLHLSGETLAAIDRYDSFAG
ncbi:MAG TPA: NUDIX hydrolase [Trebonia sp.]|jgi:8-oxo-dGTP diphosphatase|nr:NUDIX hydrolase [Trebonia sp.]